MFGVCWHLNAVLFFKKPLQDRVYYCVTLIPVKFSHFYGVKLDHKLTSSMFTILAK